MSAKYQDSGKLPIIRILRMSDVLPVSIEWLWPNKIAIGKLTLIAGDPGLGKSMITAFLAATVTTGKRWPGTNQTCLVGDVIMLSAEDDPADTIRPRLDAAGADVSRIQILTSVDVHDYKSGNSKPRSFDIGTDVTLLDELLNKNPECRLLSIDPISAYLGSADSHKNADVRALLAPLSQVASKHRVAIVAVTHLNKSNGTNAMYRSSGSLAFVASARANFMVIKDKHDPARRMFLPVKNNLGDDETGYPYTVDVNYNGIPFISWENTPVSMPIEDVLSSDKIKDTQETALDLAKGWLQDFLANGPQSTKDIQDEADKAGYSWSTVRRAKDMLGIKPKKYRFDGHWEWSLP